MKKKKLLLLGGSVYLLPVIKVAHELGLHVVTMDYLPQNIAHKYSDGFANVSVIDRQAVLEAARTMRIDGVMSFACDPGVVSAAYVAEKLGLPFQGPYDSVAVLQDKGRFRSFLAENRFNTPRAKRYVDAKSAIADAGALGWPVMVKPVDSAGSKGVTRVDNEEGMAAAAIAAEQVSPTGAVVVEEFLEFEGCHSSADPFTVDGDLRFVSYSDQLFDSEADNPYTPSLIIWPTTMEQEHQDELTRETQRLMRLLSMGTGIYNIESCVGKGGIPYLMEVSPRGGGCRIAELQRMAYGVDLITAEVAKSVGLPVEGVSQTDCDGVWCEMVVHAEPGRKGILDGIDIDPEVSRRYIKMEGITANPGDVVEPFTGANMALGDLFLRFSSREELDDVMSHSREWIRVRLA